jgi:DNA-3-methyladenine glycosylase I
LLCLEGMQAGLSWDTVLAKREGYRRAFLRFDVRKLAGLTDVDLKPLLKDEGIIRHWGKITAIRDNARVVREEFPKRGALSAHLWSFVQGAPRDNRQRKGQRLPASTPESEAMSKALRKMDFRFVGATTCYAFQQAVGMVNDHVIECFRHDAVGSR